MSSIHTLIPDIQQLLLRKDGWFDESLSQAFADEVAKRLQGQFEEPKVPSLRLSRMGPHCPKALWHSIHTPREAEPLPPWAESKFAFGHIIEAWAIALAKAAGHHVCGEQDELKLDGITGHRDCVIDGCVVDVKSAASRSFIKFKDKTLSQDDPFGYLDQLDGYLAASSGDPLVTCKDRGYLFAIDKQLGHMCLYEHTLRLQHIHERIRSYREIVGGTTPPACSCGTIPEGKSGNIKLDTRASYSAFKFCCFPRLRTFLYANGPLYLTTVKRKPDVPEIDRYGKIVYNG